LSEQGLGSVVEESVERLLANQPIARLPTFAYSRRMARIRDAVLRKLPAEIDSTRVARDAGVGPTYLPRFFRQHTGISFGTWVTKLRLSHAELLLLHTKRGIDEIAYLAGFGSTRSMPRAFRVHAGCSPTSVRDAIGKDSQTIQG